MIAELAKMQHQNQSLFREEHLIQNIKIRPGTPNSQHNIEMNPPLY